MGWNGFRAMHDIFIIKNKVELNQNWAREQPKSIRDTYTISHGSNHEKRYPWETTTGEIQHPNLCMQQKLKNCDSAKKTPKTNVSNASNNEFRKKMTDMEENA